MSLVYSTALRTKHIDIKVLYKWLIYGKRNDREREKEKEKDIERKVMVML